MVKRDIARSPSANILRRGSRRHIGQAVMMIYPARLRKRACAADNPSAVPGVRVAWASFLQGRLVRPHGSDPFARLQRRATRACVNLPRRRVCGPTAGRDVRHCPVQRNAGSTRDCRKAICLLRGCYTGQTPKRYLMVVQLPGLIYHFPSLLRKRGEHSSRKSMDVQNLEVYGPPGLTYPSGKDLDVRRFNVINLIRPGCSNPPRPEPQIGAGCRCKFQ